MLRVVVLNFASGDALRQAIHSFVDLTDDLPALSSVSNWRSSMIGLPLTITVCTSLACGIDEVGWDVVQRLLVCAAEVKQHKISRCTWTQFTDPASQANGSGAALEGNVERFANRHHFWIAACCFWVNAIKRRLSQMSIVLLLAAPSVSPSQWQCLPPVRRL